MKTTIKTIQIILFLFFAVSTTTACKKDKNNAGKTGTFTIDGINYTGNTEVQTFVNNNYSIVCQQDEPFKLIQVTFHNQAEAETGGTFNVKDDALNVPSGTVNIGIDGLTFDPHSSKTISVSGKKITISNVALDQTGGGSKHPLINSANINF